MRPVVVATVVAIPASVYAQSSIGSASQFKPVALDTLGGPPPSFIVTAPLRLALQNGILPQAGGFPNCATREEAAGNSMGGIPVSFHHEIDVVPHLVLAGFSQLGCPIDGSMGGVVAYTAPIAPSVAFVLGAGIILAPGQIPLYGGSLQTSIARQVRGAPSATGATVRADVLWKTKAGRFFTVGVGSTGTRHTLSFGGGF